MRLVKHLLLPLVVVTAAALVAAEFVMRPSASDRVTLLGVYAATAFGALVVARSASRLRRRSLYSALLVVALVGVFIVSLAVAAATITMALSSHDLRLVGVSLLFGVGAGVVVAHALSDGLVRDLRAITAAAGRFAAGDHSSRTGLDGPDEVGQVARALDTLAERVEVAERERGRVEAARREFLAAVSHDLRTPLTNLRSAVEALQDGVAEDPGRYLEAMRREIVLLSSLVDDLFLLARIESGALDLVVHRVDLAELADEAIEAAAPEAARRDVTLRYDATDHPVPVEASPRELGRVLRNLLDNATRHSPKGGVVRVTVDSRPGPTLTVCDDGPGFPLEFVGRAFESFTRADESRLRGGAGAGLGLAIARGVVAAHGGTIAARPGPGGQVTVSLPPL